MFTTHSAKPLYNARWIKSLSSGHSYHSWVPGLFLHRHSRWSQSPCYPRQWPNHHHIFQAKYSSESGVQDITGEDALNAMPYSDRFTGKPLLFGQRAIVSAPATGSVSIQSSAWWSTQSTLSVKSITAFVHTPYPSTQYWLLLYL